MTDSFGLRLKKEALFGTVITLPSTETTEILAKLGFDWLFIDYEHSTLSLAEIQRLVQTAQGTQHRTDESHTHPSAIVRIPENNPVYFKQVLDTGCDGIIVPQVNRACL